MPGGLNADTRKQLDAFRRRWRWLNHWCGVFGVAVVLLAGMAVVASADGIFLLEASIRKAGSGVVYAAALVVWFILSGRYWFRPLSDREIARRMELRWPGLAGKVLAAVELAETAKEARFDSEAFREILQRDVAERVRGLNMRAVLPGSTLNQWGVGFIAAAAAVGALMAFGPLKYETLLARAFLPWAGIERPSRIKIEVLNPAPGTAWLPVGDEFEVKVRVAGPEPDRVRLESWYGEISRTWNMALLEPGVYAAKLTIGAADARFRVTAGDGTTGVLQLPTRARPHVEHYEKEFTFPDYSGLPSRTVTEADGDLAGLEGTQVRLRMKVDQPVRAGQMVVTTENGTNTIALAAPGPDVVEVVVGLTNAATYQVLLEAAETGFRNKFAPRYEIKPWPDLPPKIALTVPEGGRVVAVDERVRIEGRAGDEIGLRRVVQQVQVNGGEWREFPLSLENPTNAVVRRDFDLILLQLGQGDRIRTRLAATDTRGTTTESEAVELVVGNPAITSVDEREIGRWRRFGEVLETVARSTAALQTSLDDEGAKKLRSDSELERRQALAGLNTTTREIEAGMELAGQELTAVMRTASPGRESARLGLLGEGVSQARHGLLPEVERESARLSAADDAMDTSRVAARARALNSHVKALDEAYRALMSRKLAGATAEYFEQLARRQEEINGRARRDAATDPNAWRRLARRQSEAAAQVAHGEQLMDPLKDAVGGNYGRRLAAAQAELRDARQQVESATRAENTDAGLGDPAEKLGREVRATEKTLRALLKEQFVAAEKAENALQRLRRSAPEELRQLNADLRRIESAARGGDREADAAREAALTNTAERLRDAARLEERRPGGDPALAAELGTAATGLDHLAGLANHEVAPDEGRRLEAAEQALRRIETAHQVTNLEQAIKQLAREERWEGDATNQTTDRTADWNWINDEINNTQREVKRSTLPPTVAQALDRAARDPVRREVGRQMLDRKNGKEPASVANELGRMAELVAEAKFAAEPAREESRRELETLAPKLSERLQRLADSARAQEAGAQRAVSGGSLSPRDLAALQDGQKRLNESVAGSLEAVRRDGNRQNIFTPQGRELARDADDATEMISRPAAAADRAMNQAIASVAPADRQAAVRNAAAENGRLADALKLVADHLRQRESGFAADTRRQLREQEEAMGIREALDRRYERAAAMERVAQGDPEALREALREQVRNDPELREEVRHMTADALAQAEASLNEAAGAQREAARQMQAAGDGEAPASAARAQAEAQSAMARAAGQLREAEQGAAALNEGMGERVARAAEEARSMAQNNPAAAAPSGGAAAAQAAEQSAQAIAQLQDRVEAERAAAGAGNGPPSPGGQQAANRESGQAGPAGEGQPSAAGNQNGGQASAGTQSGQPSGQAGTSSPNQSGQTGPAGQSQASAAGGPSGAPSPNSPNSQNSSSGNSGEQSAQASSGTQSSVNSQLGGSSAGAASSGGAGSAGGQPRPGQWLARAMNALGGENTDAKTVSPEVREALRAAFESQAEAVRMARNDAADQPAPAAADSRPSAPNGGGGEGRSTAVGEGVGGGGVNNEPIGVADAIAIDWGRLPPRVARDLRDSLREGTPGEYREQVNAYFRMIAERAAATAR